MPLCVTQESRRNVGTHADAVRTLSRERRRIMDAVTYLKTYERMRKAEGLAPFEHLFDTDATAEMKVALVEQWGSENPAKSDEDSANKLIALIAKLGVRVLVMEHEIQALKEMME